MMLDWQGRVAECTGANIFFIKDGRITPDRRLLPGRDHAAHRHRAGARRGIEVIERRLMPDI